MSLNRKVVGATALSLAGLLGIAGYEGLSLDAYQPLSGDKWTIGFGHTGDVSPGDSVSVRKALGLLYVDARSAEATVLRYVEVPLKQHQLDALVSLVFNIGPTAFKNSTLLKRLNARDYAGVQREWMRWVYFKGKRVAGLEKRRANELAVFNGEVPTVVEGAVCFGTAGCIDTASLSLEGQSGTAVAAPVDGVGG